jgi:hypothetical protein
MDQLYLYVGLQERAGVEYIKLVRPTCGCVHGITNRKDETCARDSNLFYGHNVVGKRESIRFDASEMVASALLDSFFFRRKIFLSFIVISSSLRVRTRLVQSFCFLPQHFLETIVFTGKSVFVCETHISSSILGSRYNFFSL